ncbi:hypothetical protein BC332_29056 [Capsicum chinense]|nr:hypothetical protein BC332_29056 [Capsicum chinense]
MDTELTLRDWTKLPNLVLYLILKKIVSISDFLRFSAVCKPWFSYVSKNQAELKQRINSSSIEEMPVLMILGTNQYGSTINTSLYSVTKRKIILELSFPNNDERCCGSSHGWLVFQRSDDIIYLFNPFSGETIHLPSLSYHVDKFVLSKNPSTNPYDVEVVAIVQCGFVPLGLAILRPGSNEWIVMTHGMSRHVVCDVIYYDDRYYVVTSHGRVLSIDKMTLDLNEISGPAPVSSMSVTASKFSGCIPNSVYYTGGPLEMFVLSRRSFRNSLFTSPLRLFYQRIPQPICMMLRSSLLVWLSYETHHPGGLSRHHVRDVIYYDDRYYVVASDGSVLSIDKMSLDSKKISRTGPASVRFSYSTTKFFHLIKSTANELLMVRLSRPNYFLRSSVEIFKLIVNPMNQESMFAELDDLGDEALFLSEQDGVTIVTVDCFSGKSTRYGREVGEEDDSCGRGVVVMEEEEKVLVVAEKS